MKKGIFFLVTAVVLLFGSCKVEPEVADLVKEMVVVTQYDKTTLDTASYSTFYVRMDTLAFVSNYYVDTIIVEDITYRRLGELAVELPKVVKEEGQALSWTRVDIEDDPDLIINVIVLDNLNVSLSYNYPTYYSGYYGYYNYYGYYSYNVAKYGTLVIEILDAKNYVKNGNKYKIIWNASIGDLYRSLDVLEKSVNATHQAFEQSPYLAN
jgi:hypothetical protein